MQCIAIYGFGTCAVVANINKYASFGFKCVPSLRIPHSCQDVIVNNYFNFQHHHQLFKNMRRFGNCSSPLTLRAAVRSFFNTPHIPIFFPPYLTHRFRELPERPGVAVPVTAGVVLFEVPAFRNCELVLFCAAAAAANWTALVRGNRDETPTAPSGAAMAITTSRHHQVPLMVIQHVHLI